MGKLTNNNSGTFVRCTSAATYTLVIGDDRLGDYLQAKMANFLGKRKDEVLLGTPLKIPANYANSEGVIDAMKTETGFEKGLRIDLQTAQVINGKTYATWQVQWGTGNKKGVGGAYAGALLLVDTLFSVTDLRDALTKSWGTQTYWRVDK
jgi:hypothetical protein